MQLNSLLLYFGMLLSTISLGYGNLLREEKGDKFLQSIITTDKTRIHHFTPESKRAPMKWRELSSPEPKKPKTILSASENYGFNLLGHAGFSAHRS